MNRTQEYLRTHTLEDLCSEYKITARRNPTLGVVSLNYNQFLSPMDKPIPQECRGLILYEHDWSIACRSFRKFFNYGEPNGADTEERFAWYCAALTEKYDGSLIVLWFHRPTNTWQVSTRGSADGSAGVGVTGMAYSTLFKTIVAEKYSGMFDHLDRNTFYAFEIIGPANRHTIAYADNDIIYLGAWHRHEASPGEIATMECWDSDDCVREMLLMVPVPTLCHHPCESPEDVDRWVASRGGEKCEGAVAHDESGNRIKFKHPDYIAASKSILASNNPVNIVEMIQKDTIDDLLPKLDELRRAEVQSIKDAIASFCMGLSGLHSSIPATENRKEFAGRAKKYPEFAPMLFKMYDGHEADDCIRHMHPKRLAELIGVKDH